MLKNSFIFPLCCAFFLACQPQKEKADLLIYNARIYAVDSAFTTCEAMAVKDGKIIELGESRLLLEKYEATERSDAEGNIIYPGFIDAHCHFLGYGLGLRQVNLVGTRSFSEVVERVSSFAKNKGLMDGASGNIDYHASDSWIVGRGWDQNDWENKAYPNRRQLDSLFPNRPVLLMRIDGHAALVNKKALMLAGIRSNTKIKGGLIEFNFVNGGEEQWTGADGLKEIKHMGYPLWQPTGMLIDNAVDLVKSKLPPISKKEMEEALLGAQQNCLAAGLTTLDDAGLMKNEIDLIDSLQQQHRLKLRIYAMLSDSAPNYAACLEKGPYKTARLNVRAFKFYADGALGSRGACLHHDYEDKKNWKGFLLSSRQHFARQAELLAAKGFQVNTHCIGDSALSLILDIYKKHCGPGSNRRWRLEHAQIVAPGNFACFSRNILPSVQPTHATSDMYWAGQRLGKERLKQAYAYKQLLNAAGTIALGTDFPVEDISPFKTFFAAVVRQDSKGFPAGGFQPENALTREEALRGMTIWAAYANFEEQEKGSLEKGKLADFIILDTDLMSCPAGDLLKAKVLATYINGEKVYSLR